MAKQQMKHLYRSKTNRVIAGVCGGLGEYFNIDPVIIRILWIAFTIAGGAGIIAYIIAWVVIPEAGSKQSIAEGRRSGKNYKMDNEEGRRMVMLIGAFILILGLWILINTIVTNMFGWSWIQYTWPIILIALGAIIILKYKNCCKPKGKKR